VCIPARNEERNLDAAVGGALASDGVDVEVLAYDDQSTDRTPAILSALVARDARVRAVPTVALPDGWNGKQWGCQRMGEAATGEWILFTDADVRLAPDCLARAVDEAGRLRAALLSTVPAQETGTWMERMVVPLIHWMLFSWLPMPRMRTTDDPATSAGCGQFLLVRREAWVRAGGHAAFRDSMHDGIKLPRNVRRAGLHTDLYDGSESVRCRMYRGAAQTWRGFTKNAYEGLGSPAVLAVFTLLEAGGILRHRGAARAACALGVAVRPAVGVRGVPPRVDRAAPGHPVAQLVAAPHRAARVAWADGGRSAAGVTAAGGAVCTSTIWW
jgi:glycosyltransferase involved in cell wall biosynthesis